MAYTKTVWVDDTNPELEADNLNNMENGLFNQDARITENEGDIETLDTGKLSLDQTTPQTIINGQPIQNTLTASEIVATDGDKKLQSLAVEIYPSLTELSYVKGVTSAIQTQITTEEANVDLLQTGWNSAGETWEYSSVDDPTGVITVATDLTTKYSAGMRIKFTNGGNVIYGIITVVAYSAPNTVITFLHQIDPTDSLALYLLANSAITANYYSNMKAPFGFPLNREKWSVIGYFAETLRTSPVVGTWYNIGTYKISVPIGNWDISYEGSFAEYVATTADHFLFATLSTTNNGESDTQMTAFVRANALQYFSAIVSKTKSITRTTKADYFLNEKTNTASVSAIEIAKNSQVLIKAVCGYL